MIAVARLVLLRFQLIVHGGWIGAVMGVGALFAAFPFGLWLRALEDSYAPSSRLDLFFLTMIIVMVILQANYVSMAPRASVPPWARSAFAYPLPVTWRSHAIATTLYIAILGVVMVALAASGLGVGARPDLRSVLLRGAASSLLLVPAAIFGTRFQMTVVSSLRRWLGALLSVVLPTILIFRLVEPRWGHAAIGLIAGVGLLVMPERMWRALERRPTSAPLARRPLREVEVSERWPMVRMWWQSCWPFVVGSFAMISFLLLMDVSVSGTVHHSRRLTISIWNMWVPIAFIGSVVEKISPVRAVLARLPIHPSTSLNAFAKCGAALGALYAGIHGLVGWLEPPERHSWSLPPRPHLAIECVFLFVVVTVAQIVSVVPGRVLRLPRCLLFGMTFAGYFMSISHLEWMQTFFIVTTVAHLALAAALFSRVGSPAWALRPRP